MFSGDGEVWSGGILGCRCKLSEEGGRWMLGDLSSFFFHILQTLMQYKLTGNFVNQIIYKINNFNHLFITNS